LAHRIFLRDVEVFALNLLDQTFPQEIEVADHPNQEGVDIQHNPPKGIDTPIEHQLPKASAPEPVKDQYVDSPGLPAGVVSTHDRDSVQPGGTPRPIYAPPAKLKSEEGK
jgi:hypothetical protein